MGELGREFLLLNFDGLSNPSLELKFTTCPELGNHRWGLAWYPGDDRAAYVSKDPSSTRIDPLAREMANWERFRSTTYTCRVTEATEGYTQDETQPFIRHFGDRDWLFMHRGSLDKTGFDHLFLENGLICQPFGKTDSELAFCYLLTKVKEWKQDTLFDIPFETFLSWFEALDTLGTSDIYLSDGVTILAYRGKNSLQPLFYRRFKPPNSARGFETKATKVTFDDPQDCYRTVLAFAMHPSDENQWVSMNPGQLVIARRGSILWDNTQKDIAPLSYSVKLLENEKKLEKVGPHSVINIRSITQSAEGLPLTYRSYEVKHVTKYSYSERVERSTHVFRLQPVEDAIQEVVHSEIQISNNGDEVRYQDVFGNESIYYTIHKPYDKLTITSTNHLKIFAFPENDPEFRHRQSSIPLIWMPWQRQMMLAYLLPPELPESQLSELTAYAMSFVERNDYHLLDTIEDMNLTIYRDYEYMPGSTSLITTPFEIYAERKGVCQDFANLFICLARLLSIPARYRMGYIHTGSEYENKIQSEASHAWVEFYLPYMGWRGFDPTNGCAVGQDHIRVACGRNYIDATPTSGTLYQGGGEESLEAQVEVREIFPNTSAMMEG